MMRHVQSGFTAVELLITLFIAAIFLFAGYQLYIQVTRDGADTKLAANASNAVYEEMRKHAGQTPPNNPIGCNPAEWDGTPTGGSQRTLTNPPSTPNVLTAQTTIGGIQLQIYTEIRCPFSTVSPPQYVNVFHITTIGTYTDKGVSKKVSHSTYANN